MISSECFVKKLREVYQNNPCGALPNALWKTLVQARADGAVRVLQRDAEGTTQLALKIDGVVPCWWHREQAFALPFPDAQMLLLHQRDLKLASTDIFPSRNGYFRLAHALSSVETPALPTGYTFAPVDCHAECGLVADVIGRCYDELNPGEETVREWITHPVFDADLWVWVLDDAGLPAALGIAELDVEVGEGSLEWIQVLPSQRRKGLGRAVALELLRRLSEKAKFATVAGRIDGVGVERLYRSCGFAGDDVWWVVHQ